MKNKKYDDVVETTEAAEEVTEVIETETEPTTEPEIETTETETETVEADEQDEATDTETNAEPDETTEEDEEKSEPVEPVKDSKEKKKTGKKTEEKQEDDTDAELDAFFEKLRKNKEKKERKEPTEPKEPKGESAKIFTQEEFDKALKSVLAKKLPPKEEMEQFKHWKEEQQTIEEKLSVMKVQNAKLTEENESLRHENTVVKAGVNADAVDFVLFKVEKMEGDFNDNLQDYLKEHKKYLTPRTTVVEGADHKAKPKASISKKELDEMDYASRAKYKEQHPDEYAKAMGR